MGTRPETLEETAQLAKQLEAQLAARLDARIDALEQRVTALELIQRTQETSRSGASQLPSAHPLHPAVREHGPAVESGSLHSNVTVIRSAATTSDDSSTLFGAFPVLGAALLGIAGAYMLRAVSGANPVMRGLIALLAAVYAAGWLFAAGKACGRRFAVAVYAGTSLLILAPMLWEVTLRFRAMSPLAAALIVAVFTAAAFTIRLRSSEGGIGIALAGLAFTGLALSIATHRMAEFTAVLVAMYALSTVIKLEPVLRGVLACVADVAVWTLLIVYRLAPAERTDYPVVPAPIVVVFAAVVFLISAARIGWRCVKLRELTSSLDALQSTVSLAVLLTTMLWLFPATDGATAGALCIALGAFCAAGAYGPFRDAARRRNFHLFSIWAMVLVSGGLFVLLPVELASTCMALLGTAMMLQARRPGLAPLTWYGLALLSAGAFGCGLLSFGIQALAGIIPGLPSWNVAATMAMSSLLLIALPQRPTDPAAMQVARLLQTLLAVLSIAALAVITMTAAARTMLTPAVFHIALIRTIALCATAVALAVGGGRTGRRDLVRASYVALALVAAKLLYEDLPHGQMGYIAASIFLVAITMIAVPRMGQRQGVGSRE